MARPRSTYVCSECGGEQSRWLGRCPDCGACRDARRGGARIRRRAQRRVAAAAPRRASSCRSRRSRLERADAHAAPGIAELDRVLGGGLVPGLARAARRRAGRRQVEPDGRDARRDRRAARRCCSWPARSRPSRCGCAPSASARRPGVGVLAETELETVCATIEAEAPDVCVVDSVQTLWDEQLGSAPGLGLAGARGRRAPAAPGQGARHLHRPDRARDEGGRRRRARACSSTSSTSMLMFEGDAAALRCACCARRRTASARPTRSASSR